MVTQQQFQDFKTEAIKNQPIRKTIRLSELNFRTMDTVEYNGIYLGCNRQALKDLFRILGMTQAAYSNLQSSLGEETSTSFLNTLKNAISSAKSLELTIAVTPDRVISRIEKAGQSSIISADTYFDTFERMANEHNLEIKSNPLVQNTKFVQGVHYHLLTDKLFHNACNQILGVTRVDACNKLFLLFLSYI